MKLYKCLDQKGPGIILDLRAQVVDTKNEAQLAKGKTLAHIFIQSVLNRDNRTLEALVLKHIRQLQEEEDPFLLRRQKKMFR